jgi:Do/DeqQ family serine protease
MSNRSTHASRRHPAAFTRLLILVLVAMLPVALTAQPAGGIAGQQVPSLAPVIEQVSPAVVNIQISGRVSVNNPLANDPFFRRFFDLPEQPQLRPVQSAGSGVIVNAREGYIITNHHVVEEAERITVTLSDSRVMEARVIGSDAGSDVAVLKVEGNGLTEISIGDSDSLRVGDYVLAIGNPFGIGQTVTSGIVSGLGRSGINPDGYEDFIQTDASINPGNSGGALINLRGELVGINSAILSRSGGNIGIGFAIPVKMARNVMEQLIDYGEVSRGLLGVSINSVTPETAAMYGLDDTTGALVMSVSAGSAAEQAGIRIEDIIVAVNDRPVRDPGALRAAIGLQRPGERVTISFIREGQRRSVTAVLGAQDAALASAPSRRTPEGAPGPEELADIDPVFEGARLATNDATQPGFSGLAGVLVVDIAADSQAWQRGLRRGDVITYVNRQRVRSMADARGIIEDARSVILQVQRGNRDMLLPMR